MLRVLRENKTATGWTLADIKGINPVICMHTILLKDDAKPVREPQRKLNPTMKEVVMKEILKLLDQWIIYLISDSQWVSLVHVVPKKTSLTLVPNEKNELVPNERTCSHESSEWVENVHKFQEIKCYHKKRSFPNSFH